MNSLYHREYDFPHYKSTPHVEYMIASIPRSGSTHLSLELWRRGVFGAPLEYPNPPFMEIFLAERNIEDKKFYWKELRKRRTSFNGVFGYKMFMKNYYDMKERFSFMLGDIHPNKVVYLTRKNVVEQAVSYSKAIRTNAWFGGVFTEVLPCYSFKSIKECEEKIHLQLKFWELFFDIANPEVKRVHYEDLVSDPVAFISDIAEFLGVEKALSKTIDLPTLTVQRDSRSTEWAARYIDEKNNGLWGQV